MTKVDNQILREIERRARELISLERFSRDPSLRKRVRDRCYEKACQEYGVQPRRKHG